MRHANYWLGDGRRPKPIVDLGGARCHRCPRRIRQVPVDKVRLHADGRADLRRVFICPHCRVEVHDPIAAAEASRLFAAGVAVQRSRKGPRGGRRLTEDEVIRFGLAAQFTENLVDLALRDPSDLDR